MLWESGTKLIANAIGFCCIDLGLNLTVTADRDHIVKYVHSRFAYSPPVFSYSHSQTQLTRQVSHLSCERWRLKYFYCHILELLPTFSSACYRSNLMLDIWATLL